MYPGQSTLNGDIVYCDNNSVMWSPTLVDEVGNAKTYQWKTEDTALPSYAKGDCNNLKDKDIVDYPACQACRNLDYAGFSEGWYLPNQRKGILVENCNAACARDCEYYHAPGRQLWDFGAEQCPHWGTKPCNESQGACSFTSGHITWDPKAQPSHYWSSTQRSATNAWYVHFTNANTNNNVKSTPYYVRCALGNYNK